MTGLEFRISFTCIVKATNEVALTLSENNRGNDSGRYIDAISKSWRSIIPSNVPKDQYFSLPPNSTTKAGNRHGVHYIKLFPIDSKYIQRYRIENNIYMQGIKSILDKNERNIIAACQNYLYECEQSRKNPNTPDIDGNMQIWLKPA